jgi:hypothetical protein
MDQNHRKPNELALALRNRAADTRRSDTAALKQWEQSAWREGHAQLLEEAAAVLESPNVLASLQRLMEILGVTSGWPALGVAPYIPPPIGPTLLPYPNCPTYVVGTPDSIVSDSTERAPTTPKYTHPDDLLF